MKLPRRGAMCSMAASRMARPIDRVSRYLSTVKP
jgi:hypothetical protein